MCVRPGGGEKGLCAENRDVVSLERDYAKLCMEEENYTENELKTLQV